MAGNGKTKASLSTYFFVQYSTGGVGISIDLHTLRMVVSETEYFFATSVIG